MSDQTVIDPGTTNVATTPVASSPAEDFANEIAASNATITAPATAAVPAASTAAVAAPADVATPVAADAAPTAATAVNAVNQDISGGVKDFSQAFSFVEQGVLKLGDAAKDELIALARKYL